MTPGGDIVADLGLNVAPAVQQYSSFARSLPPVNVPISLAGLGPNGLGRITGQANDFSRALESSTARVVAFGLSAGSVYAISRAFDSLIRTTIDVQKSMAQINAIANLGSSSLTKFTNDLFNSANLTGQSWKVAADTALQFSRQGLSVNETLKRTTDALTLVRIGGLDVADSVRALTTVLNAYNDTMLDSTIVTNKLLTVDTQFPIAGKDLADALTRVSSIAKDTGVSFDKLIGLITAAKSITGRTGDVIGTALGTIFQRINRPQVLDQLKELGVQTQTVNGDMLSSDQILTNLSKTYSSLSSAQQNQLAQQAGGVRQGNIFRALMQDLNRENSIFTRATLVSADATDLAAKRQAALNQTLAAQLNQAKNNIVNISSQGGGLVFSPVTKELAGTANTITSTISNALSSDKTSTIGQQIGGVIGTGLLKGLGTFLEGPGLLLLTAVLVKFGQTFSGYIGKAFVTLLETTSKEYQAQQALTVLVSQMPSLQDRIVAAAGNELKIREAILNAVREQSLIQQQNVSLGNIGVALAGEGKLSLSGSRFSRPFNFASDPLSDSINQERLLTGLSPDKIKVASSEVLKTIDNPLGLGVYNLRDEPNGLNQGIQRILKGKGKIPIFAEENLPYPYNLLPSAIGYKSPAKTPPFDITSIVPDYIKYGQPPSLPKEPKLLSEHTPFRLPQYTPGTKSELESIFSQLLQNQPKLLTQGAYSPLPQDLNFDIPQEIKNKYQQLFNPSIIEAIRNDPSLSEQKKLNLLKTGSIKEQTQSFEESIGQNPIKGINPIAYDIPKFTSFNKEVENYINSVKKGLIDPTSEAATKIEKELSAKARYIENQHPIYQGFQKQVENAISGAQQQQFGSPLLVAARQNDLRLANSLEVQRKADSVTGFGSFAPWNWRRNSGTLEELRKNPEGRAALATSRQAFAGKALLTSIGAPIIGGILEQGITSGFGDNQGTRRTNSIIGAGTSAASFAGIGAIFGPEGALAGGVVGGITGIIQAISKWNDILPDLQKNLEASKEATQKTAESISGYLEISNKLADVYSGNTTGLSKGDVRRLELQQQQALLQIPDIGQRRQLSNLVKSGNFSGANDLQASINQQNQNSVAIQSLLTQLNTKGFIPDETSAYGASSTISGNFGSEVLKRTLSFNPILPFVPSILYQDQINPNQKLLQQQQALRDSVVESTANQFTSNIFGLTSKTTGKSFFDILKDNPNIAGQFGKSKSLDEFSGTLIKTGLQQGLNPLDLANINLELTSIKDKSAQQQVLTYLNDLLSPKGIQKAIDRAKDYESTIQKQEDAATKLNDQIDKLNDKFANAAAQIQKINLDNLTNLIIELNTGESDLKTQNQINLIKSGGGRYQENANILTESLLGAADKQIEGNEKAAEDLSDNIVESFRKTIQNTLDKTHTKLSSSKILEAPQINEQIDKLSRNLDLTYSLDRKNLTPQNIDNLIKTLEDAHSAASKYVDAASDVLDSSTTGGKVLNSPIFSTILGGSNTDLIKNIYGGLIGHAGSISDLSGTPGEQAIEQLRTIKLKYEKTIEDIQRQYSISRAEAIQKYSQNTSIYDVEFGQSRIEQGNKNLLGLGQLQQENLYKNQLGTGLNPFQEFRVQSNLRRIQEQGQILGGLYNTPAKSLGITNIEQFQKALNSPQTPDVYQALTKAQDELNAAKAKGNEIDKQDLIELQRKLTFSDEYVNAIRAQNVNAARSGTLTGQNYKLAFETPFAYNKQTFNRDLITQASELGDILKNTLSEGIREAGRSAKTATDFFRSLAINLGTNLASRGANLGINSLFGLVGQGLGLDITKGFASGGFVNMGSGTKDDVPAMLSGGEFVVNKRATQMIGKNNLDVLNNYPKFAGGGVYIQPTQYQNISQYSDTSPAAITSDSIKLGNNSVDIGLANEYILGSQNGYAGIGGYSNISPYLSAIGATSKLNPQNQLRSAREKYGYNRQIAYNRYKGELGNYDINQYLALGQAYVGAAGIVGGQALKPSPTTGGSILQSPGGGISDQLNLNPELNFSSPAYDYLGGSSSSSFTNSDLLSLITKGADTGLGTTSKVLKSGGGYIPRFSGGGYFGGDSPTDKLSAMVMGGEYVVGSKNVNKFGKSYFEGLNKVGSYATGGSVSSNSYLAAPNDSSSKIIDVLGQISNKLISTNQGTKNVATNNIPSINHTSNITVNMNSNGQVTNTTATSNTVGGNQNNKQTKDNLNTLSQLINNQVIDVINAQSRNGGILYNKFQLNANAQ